MVGTRDAQLRPAVYPAFGAIASADGSRVTVFLSNAMCATALDDVADNGRVALTFSRPSDYETFQIKGHAVETAPMTRDRMAIQDVWFEKLVTAWSAKGYGAFCRGWALRPAPAVTFEVEMTAPARGPGVCS